MPSDETWVRRDLTLQIYQPGCYLHNQANAAASENASAPQNCRAPETVEQAAQRLAALAGEGHRGLARGPVAGLLGADVAGVLELAQAGDEVTGVRHVTDAL